MLEGLRQRGRLATELGLVAGGDAFGRQAHFAGIRPEIAAGQKPAGNGREIIALDGFEHMPTDLGARRQVVDRQAGELARMLEISAKGSHHTTS